MTALQLRFPLKADMNLFLAAFFVATDGAEPARVVNCTKSPAAVYVAIAHPLTLDGRDVRNIAAPFGGRKHRGGFPSPLAVARRGAGL